LRTPLNTITGFAELLLPGSPIRASAAQRQEYALHILRSGRHLAEMINDILDYSALARSGPRLDLAWCGAEDVVCTAAAAAAAVRSAVEIRCSAVAARELELEVDPRRFRQIMDNLIGNAVRFTPGRRPGGVDGGTAAGWRGSDSRARHRRWHPAGGHPACL
jgi:signal transduction histidine kinase